ncbi:hypothetical protein C1H46_004177 [Malus baccata]|uniref:IBH1-like N-terminal domain-containing protein n=1 Tax=Malus baccata TaxID=106549 RepID=A0A540NGN9_MALBA|nr:hypothetical protein C1H46_004177 [Malus baccata]
MRNFSSCCIKQEFLKKWIKGLQVCNSSTTCSKKKMTKLDRKKAIKLSADIAIASTRNGTTCWSRAVIANATHSNGDNNRIFVERTLGGGGRLSEHCGRTKASRSLSSVMHKKILKKSRRVCSRTVLGRKHNLAKTHSIAKRLVRKKTQVLKSLVPGGESMDELSLVVETLDYIVSLRAQVEVMRCLATTAELLNGT